MKPFWRNIGKLEPHYEWWDWKPEVWVFRSQRMAELSTIATASVFNQVYPLQKPDYSKDVTEASHKAYVLVHLTSSLGTNIESRLLTKLWREMGQKFGDIKFCEIRADLCIEGYPERNTPTILIYRDGDIKKQIITLRELGGEQTTVRGKRRCRMVALGPTHSRRVINLWLDLENLCLNIGALSANDHRLMNASENRQGPLQSSIRSSRMDASTTNEDDDEWD